LSEGVDLLVVVIMGLGQGRGFGFGRGRGRGRGRGKGAFSGYSCVKFAFFAFNVVFWVRCISNVSVVHCRVFVIKLETVKQVEVQLFNFAFWKLTTSLAGTSCTIWHHKCAWEISLLLLLLLLLLILYL